MARTDRARCFQQLIAIHDFFPTLANIIGAKLPLAILMESISRTGYLERRKHQTVTISLPSLETVSSLYGGNSFVFIP
jgi:hypothetical protein